MVLLVCVCASASAVSRGEKSLQQVAAVVARSYLRFHCNSVTYLFTFLCFVILMLHTFGCVFCTSEVYIIYANSVQFPVLLLLLIWKTNALTDSLISDKDVSMIQKPKQMIDSWEMQVSGLLSKMRVYWRTTCFSSLGSRRHGEITSATFFSVFKHSLKTYLFNILCNHWLGTVSSVGHVIIGYSVVKGDCCIWRVQRITAEMHSLYSVSSVSQSHSVHIVGIERRLQSSVLDGNLRLHKVR